MASMIAGDFVEAYVLKNACKEMVRRAEANADAGEAAPAAGKKKANNGASEKTAEASKGEGGSFFGLVKKKVHPKVGPSGASSRTAPIRLLVGETLRP